jgi:type I restriction enzyme S subunit
MNRTKFKDTEIGRIPEDWEIKTIEEISIYVNRGVAPKYTENGICVYNQRCVRNGLLKPENIKYHDLKRKYPLEKQLQDYDILINSTGVGTLGRVANVKNKIKCIALADSHLTIVRLNNKIANSEFISYYLILIQNKLESMGEGTSGQQELPRNSIKKIKIPYPCIYEQKAIAKILSGLDDKIELNIEMNKTLEKIGQAIFKHWFVDFEFPNEEGKPYKSSDGKMVDSELGEIPEGWRIGILGDLGKIQPGYAFKSKDFTNDGCGLVKIKNICKNGLVNLEFESYLPESFIKKIDSKFHLNSGDVIIAMTGAELGKIGVLSRTNNTFLLNQRVGKIISNSKYLIYLWLKSNYFQAIMKGTSSSSSAQGNISNSDIENIELVIPNVKILKMFNIIIYVIYKLIIENLGQNERLSQIRDSILPKLMSGKIRIN